eukprot:TRINITY_DN8533_c0_g1_i1.p1 TRINITY_DN8533_c0_g1~~TRINITY_DN8533_c0_g1_i1.p1  ORF type:complete len:238 (+),score=26.94 TRINITY_DN8533_c0_g1_i1:210-923(+)
MNDTMRNEPTMTNSSSPSSTLPPSPFDPHVCSPDEEKKEKKRNWLSTYFTKWNGKGRGVGVRSHAYYGFTPVTPAHLKSYFFAWLGAFLGLAATSLLHYFILTPHQYQFMIGSFGASAILIYGVPKSPLAQPRNLLGGHLVSAIVGCVSRAAFLDSVGAWFAVSMAVPTALVLMDFTDTTHPPGGATALLAVISPPIAGSNFLFIVLPTLSGALVMLLVALLINNIPSDRGYPMYWW